MAFNCGGVVALQPLLAPWLRRLDRSRLLAVSAVLFAVGYGLYGLLPLVPASLGPGNLAQLSLYLAGAASWTVGEVVGFPAASSLVADLSPASLRGRYQGAFSMVWGSAMFLSPILGGQALEHLGAPALWALCLVAGLAVAAGHLAAAPARRGRLAALAAQPGASSAA
jgi:MFS family permease